jgi:hypothetical protein
MMLKTARMEIRKYLMCKDLRIGGNCRQGAIALFKIG